MSGTEPKCLTEFVAINSVPIQICQFGLNSSILKSFDPSNKNPKSRETCLIFLPGEVGDVQLYTCFLKSLYQKLNLPIIAIGHAGHSRLVNEQVYDCFSKNCEFIPSDH